MKTKFLGMELFDKNISAEIEKNIVSMFAAAGLEDKSLTISFINEKEMIFLQEEFKQKNYATDVLSFPVPESEKMFAHTKDILGDIAICVDKALEQAEEYGHSLAEEVSVLAAHGLFHLLGYDHEESSEEADIQMQGEMYLLECAGLKPELSLIGRA